MTIVLLAFAYSLVGGAVAVGFDQTLPESERMPLWAFVLFQIFWPLVFIGSLSYCFFKRVFKS